MKRFTQKNSAHTMSELNITPLLDLAFVLLIIFVITTPLLENSIEVNLPNAKSQSKPIDPATVRTVSVDKKGAIYLEKERLDPGQLDSAFRRLKAQHPDVGIILRADRDIRYQELVTVFDALQRAKITKVGLVNNPES